MAAWLPLYCTPPPPRPSSCCVTKQDAMHYFVDNLWRSGKAPYCSNCSRDADCMALLLVREAGGG
jgi:hypothetical protein